MTGWLSVIFFFSSKRRHLRFWRDWISDVSSSDLPQLPPALLVRPPPAADPRVPGGVPRNLAVHRTQHVPPDEPPGPRRRRALPDGRVLPVGGSVGTARPRRRSHHRDGG